MSKRKKLAAGVLVLVIAILAACVFYLIRDLKYPPRFETTDEPIGLSNDEIFAHIERIVSFGTRRPGSPGEKKTREYIVERFREARLEPSIGEPYPVTTYNPGDCSIELNDLGTGESLKVPCFPIPFSKPTSMEGLQGPVIYLAEGGEIKKQNLTGKIAIFEQRFKKHGLKTFSHIMYFNDPADSLSAHPEPPTPDNAFEHQIYEATKAKGAIGMIGLLSGLAWDSDRYWPQMNDGLEKDMPGVWVRPSLCESVRSFMERKKATGQIRLSAETGRSEAANITAYLPGSTDEYYVVMCHHDSYFGQAVQDASGVAVVLALAKHFAEVREQHPLRRGILFLSDGAHTQGRLGENVFVDRHLSDLVKKAALVVAVEHVGRVTEADAGGHFRTSDAPSFRMFFTTWNRDITGAVRSAIEANDFESSAIIPQSLVRKMTGEARGISGEFFERGLPVVGLLSAPPYLFFQEDTPDAVARDQLAPTCNVIISMLRTVDDMPFARLNTADAGQPD